MKDEYTRISTDDTQGGHSRTKEALGDPLDKELTRCLAYIVVCIHFNLPIRAGEKVIMFQVQSKGTQPNWSTDTTNQQK